MGNIEYRGLGVRDFFKNYFLNLMCDCILEALGFEKDTEDSHIYRNIERRT